MIRRVTIFCMVMALLGGFWIIGAGWAAEDENGPEEMVLKTTKDKAKKSKTVKFPHRQHQKRIKCEVCHHSKGDDGKQKKFVEGQKIQKCEECHYKGSDMPSKKPSKAEKAKGLRKLDTFKDAAHVNCRECHKAAKKKDPKLKKKWKKCLPCHIKAKKK